MSFYLLNGFCPTMLAQSSARLFITAAELGHAQVMARGGLRSGISDANVIAMYAEALCRSIELAENVPLLNQGDTALVGVFSTLPEGGIIKWFHLKVLSPADHV